MPRQKLPRSPGTQKIEATRNQFLGNLFLFAFHPCNYRTSTTMTVEDTTETPGPPGETDDEMKARKRKERLEQNRISARESRKRKKTMIEELQRTVITLSKENKELNERNETLRRQLMEIGAKVGSLVFDETSFHWKFLWIIVASYRACPMARVT